jgi:hypothetical protein
VFASLRVLALANNKVAGLSSVRALRQGKASSKASSKESSKASSKAISKAGSKASSKAAEQG